MKITVISPSTRPNGLKIVAECLQKQTFRDFEWLVCSPYDSITLQKTVGVPFTWLTEQVLKPGNFYGLNRAWNRMFKEAKGELIVSIVDYTRFNENTLQMFWDFYTENPVTCYSSIGVQMDKDQVVWTDPRIKETGELRYAIMPHDMEFRLASLPLRGIKAVGGMDEVYDTVAANSEKELCLRMQQLGYIFVIDARVPYISYKHEEHGKVWDEKYKESVALLSKHSEEIASHKRLRISYVDR